MADENSSTEQPAPEGQSQETATDTPSGSFFGQDGSQDAPKQPEEGKPQEKPEQDPSIPEGYFKKPGEGASEEEIAAYRAQIGVPEKSDGYDFSNMPTHVEFDDGTKVEYILPGGLIDALHKGGASQDVINSIVDWDVQAQQAFAKEQAEELNAKRKDSVDTLNKEWGKDAKRNWALAERALSELGGDDFKNEAKRLGLLDNQNFARFAAAAGGLIGEDTLNIGKTGKGKNPFDGDGNVTEQGRIINSDPEQARRLIEAAGKKPGEYGL